MSAFNLVIFRSSHRLGKWLIFNRYLACHNFIYTLPPESLLITIKPLLHYLSLPPVAAILTTSELIDSSTWLAEEQ